MIAIKAHYSNRKIILIDEIPEKINTAKLTIIVEPIDEPDQISDPSQESQVSEMDYYDEYKLIGLRNFFSSTDDKNIDWEEYFGLR